MLLAKAYFDGNEFLRAAHALRSTLAFGISGLPGGVDYAMLVLVKGGRGARTCASGEGGATSDGTSPLGDKAPQLTASSFRVFVQGCCAPALAEPGCA